MILDICPEIAAADSFISIGGNVRGTQREYSSKLLKHNIV